jgi:hypothetical protein
MVDERQGWSKAYHFHLDEDLTITQAMKLRQGNDPRAGDLHCHRDCYLRNTGDRLLTRKEAYDGSKKAHFARWPSETNSPSMQSQCGKYSHARSKRESMDYSQYFFKFEEYLNGLIGNGDPYFISSVERGNGLGEPDFFINHEKNKWSLSKTYVTIIDENKRRNRRLKSYTQSNIIDGRNINVVITISEYTVAQLDDFARGGIDKFEIFWQNSIKRIDDEIKRIKDAEFAEIARMKYAKELHEENERLKEKRAEEFKIKSKDRVAKESQEIQSEIDKIVFDEFLPPEVSVLLEQLELEIDRSEKAQDDKEMNPQLFDDLIKATSKLQSVYLPMKDIYPRKIKVWRTVGEYDWLVGNFGLDFFRSTFKIPEGFDYVLGSELKSKDTHIGYEWIHHHGNKVFIISDIEDIIDASYFLICGLWQDSKELFTMKKEYIFNRKYRHPTHHLRTSDSICAQVMKEYGGQSSFLKSHMVEFCKSMKLPTSGTKAELCDRIIEYEKMNWNPKDSDYAFLSSFLKSNGSNEVAKIVRHIRER